MPKLKTRKAAVKRLRRTGTGGVTRTKSWAQTLRRKKSRRARRAKTHEQAVTGGQLKQARRLLAG
jgi:large subunit ribosomal protein L35